MLQRSDWRRSYLFRRLGFSHSKHWTVSGYFGISFVFRIYERDIFLSNSNVKKWRLGVVKRANFFSRLWRRSEVKLPRARVAISFSFHRCQQRWPPFEAEACNLFQTRHPQKNEFSIRVSNCKILNKRCCTALRVLVLPVFLQAPWTNFFLSDICHKATSCFGAWLKSMQAFQIIFNLWQGQIARSLGRSLGSS